MDARLGMDTLHTHCLAKPGTSFDYVFGPQTTVYRVANKVFLMVGHAADPQYVTYRVDEEEALAQRQEYPAVQPGYYSNKRLSNTVYLDGTVPADAVLEWVDGSYDIVVARLPRRVRDELTR